MKRRLDFGRMQVDSSPQAIYTTRESCTVTLWCLPNLELEEDDPQDFTHVYVETDKDLCTVSDGMPLPEDHPVDVPLAAGESLYAVTADIAVLGYVAFVEV